MRQQRDEGQKRSLPLISIAMLGFMHRENPVKEIQSSGGLDAYYRMLFCHLFKV